MAIGSLIVEVSGNVARISEDMDKIRSTVQTNLERIDGFVEATKTALSALGAGALVGLGFEELRGKIDAVIESSAGLVNVAAKTGATVEGFSALAEVAKVAGVGSDALAGGLVKLDKSLAALEAGTPKTVQAFAALGLSAKDFVGLSADEAFQKVAEAMAKFQDGTEKTAAAVAIFGRAGAELIPVLRDTAAGTDLVTKVTKEQAQQAEEYEKTLRRLQLAHEDLYRVIGVSVTPVLNAFSKAMLEALTSTDGLNASVKGLAADNSIQSWAESTAKAVAFVIDAFDGVWRVVRVVGKSFGAVAADIATALSGNFSALKQQMADEDAEIDAILNKPTFSDRLAKQLEEARKPITEAAKPKLELHDVAVGPGSDKAVLQEQLKGLQEFITSENDLLKQRDEQLKRLYDADKLSIADYFGGLRTAQELHLAEVQSAYQREIAAIQDYIAKATDEKTATAGRTQLQTVQAQADRAAQAEGAALAKITDDQAKATEAYAKTVDNLNVKLLTLHGNLVAAAEAQLQVADKQIKARATLEGDSSTLANVAALEKSTTDQAAINQLKNQAALIEQNLGTEVGRVNLAVQLGQIGELQGLAQTDAARRAQIAQLEQIADQYLAIAKAADDNGKSLAAAEAFKLKIDQLAASTDSLGKKFEDVFKNNLETSLSKVISHTETVSQAFRKMFDSITAQLEQLAEKDIVNSIFGSGGGSAPGGGGGLFGLLGGIFGGSTAASGSGSGGAAGGFGAILSLVGKIFGGGKADGGYASAGSAYVVGERGPEIFAPASSGTVIPAGGFGGTVHIHLPAGVPQTRESMAIAGAAAARQLAIAHARNN
jgi:hypothetical protein